ncbi:UDP-N-acetyl-D-mannosamine dehydrogenase [Dickeya lacustris]|uniref:UDP-N-acetyl-D-mannosamine dehydrogenase n=1 Tax=Dickeya lacustris TaxID=2259638 RepID=A0ABY8G3M3_9GAMM|nr:UDP-N-acetyl-D-mannosamine dehydrogenase [Dickeya lacustris]WFN54555.1 UDP-N-acetyl-D-mannosamine dehydrogenase [Dickeya lacustris]
MSIERICVVGLGYIGLPTAVLLATTQRQVFGVDVNPRVVEQLNRGHTHIDEPGLGHALQQVCAQGYLQAGAKPRAAEVFIIAVPTPVTATHQPDLSQVQAAAESLAPVLKRGDVVILESTSPVGTTESVAAWLAQARPDLRFPHQAGEQADVHLAYCPERVLPGRIMSELVSNDRVIGGMTAACSARARELYRLFVDGECVITDVRTAEMCKLVENSFRDVNIAFANELSMLCAQQQIDVWELIRLANRHPRVNILQPGPGVGGHCIAVDPWFLIARHPEQTQLIRCARTVNDTKPHWVVEQVKIAVADALASRRQPATELCIACLGLAFKADVADLRESPALAITEQIATWHPGRTWVVEPNLAQLPPALQGRAVLVDSTQALALADIMVVLVDHRQFRAITPEQVTQHWVVDTKGIWRNTGHACP